MTRDRLEQELNDLASVKLDMSDSIRNFSKLSNEEILATIVIMFPTIEKLTLFLNRILFYVLRSKFHKEDREHFQSLQKSAKYLAWLIFFSICTLVGFILLVPFFSTIIIDLIGG